MAKERSRQKASELRKRAEKILAEEPQAIRTMAPADIQKLIQELNVHQIELELQNEELRRTQLELQEARDKYLNLYDLAPTGYFTLDRNSLIVDVNLAGSELLGSEKARLIGTRFTLSISPDSQDAFYFHYREALKTGIKGNCEIKMLKADGTPFHAQLISMGIPEKDGNINHCRTAAIDITERKHAEENLRESEEKYRNLIVNAPIGIVISTREGRILEINKARLAMAGYSSKEEYISKPISERYYDPKDREHWMTVLREKGKVEGFEVRFKRKDNTLYWCSLTSIPQTTESGEQQFIIVAQDITERKHAEENLRESEERYRTLFESAAEGILITDIGTKKLKYANPAICTMLGYSQEELTKMGVGDIHPKISLEHVLAEFAAQARGEKILSTLPCLKKDGTIVYADINATKALIDRRECNIGFFTDITKRKQAEEQIRASLGEKESLLKEVHHRVKNNLQIIASLLNLQSSYVTDQHIVEIFRMAEERVKSIARVHESLYRSPDLAKIDFGVYMREMAEELIHLYTVAPIVITLEAEVAELPLGIDVAIPCGLIINELVTNSLKHAFPGRSKGKIRVQLRAQENKQAMLIVGDNGIGFPKDLDFRNTRSLGMQLVVSLTKQLKGTIDLDRRKGTEWRILFTLPG